MSKIEEFENEMPACLPALFLLNGLKETSQLTNQHMRNTKLNKKKKKKNNKNKNLLSRKSFSLAQQRLKQRLLLPCDGILEILVLVEIQYNAIALQQL